ncbi:MAG: dTMP kinase [Planctomycetota bacterium]
MGSNQGWIQNLRGRFFVFDGPDGSGKSTQFRRLVAAAEAEGVGVCEVREPGGTHIGEEIRKVLLDPSVKEDVDVRCEMLLFMASRAQLIAQKIRPALAAGQLVLADRFISSTLAYQGTAGGLPIADILKVGQVALGQHWPDLVVVFDVDEETAAQRINPLLREREFNADRDRMEAKGAAFHRRVRQGYLDQAADDPGRYLVIDATRPPEAVFGDLLDGLSKHYQ